MLNSDVSASQTFLASQALRQAADRSIIRNQTSWKEFLVVGLVGIFSFILSESIFPTWEAWKSRLSALSALFSFFPILDQDQQCIAATSLPKWQDLVVITLLWDAATMVPWWMWRKWSVKRWVLTHELRRKCWLPSCSEYMLLICIFIIYYNL